MPAACRIRRGRLGFDTRGSSGIGGWGGGGGHSSRCPTGGNGAAPPRRPARRHCELHGHPRPLRVTCTTFARIDVPRIGVCWLLSTLRAPPASGTLEARTAGFLAAAVSFVERSWNTVIRWHCSCFSRVPATVRGSARRNEARPFPSTSTLRALVHHHRHVTVSGRARLDVPRVSLARWTARGQPERRGSLLSARVFVSTLARLVRFAKDFSPCRSRMTELTTNRGAPSSITCYTTEHRGGRQRAHLHIRRHPCGRLPRPSRLGGG